MQITGIVHEIRSDRAIVRVNRNQLHCEGASCGGCGACHHGGHVDDLPVSPYPTWLQKGMRVELDVVIPNQAISALLVFGLPLAGVGLGIFVAYLCSGERISDILIGSIGGLFFSLILLSVIDRSMRLFGMGVRLLSDEASVNAGISPKTECAPHQPEPLDPSDRSQSPL